MIARTTFVALLLLGRVLLQGVPAFAQEEGTSEPPSVPAPPDTPVPDAPADAEEEAGSADDYELPDDLDEVDGGDDWDLPPEEEDGGEWDFDAALKEADEDGPPELPIFGATTFTATSTTRAQYRFENFDANTLNDDFFSAWERLEAAMQGEELRLGARLDFFLPLAETDCPEGSEGSCIEGDIRLERFSLHWDHGPWTVDAVDSYAVLGRGIALSFRRLDILGVDTALRGGQVAYDNGHIFFKALGGAANPQNLDPNTLAIIRRPADQLRRDLFEEPRLRDWIMGGELGFRVEGFELGAHAARYLFAPTVSGIPSETDLDIFGWRAGLPQLAGGKLGIYGEANLSRRSIDREFGDDAIDHGRAIYASIQIQASERATVAIEWKDYRRFYVSDSTGAEVHRVYSAVPDLELDTERPENQSNARGGRIQLDYGFLPGDWGISTALLSYGHAERGDPWSRDGFLLNHGTFKVQKVIRGEPRALDWTFDLLAGYRDDRYLGARDDQEAGELHWRVIHGQIEAGIVSGAHSFELTVIHRQESKWNALRLDFDDYVRGSASFTYSWQGRIRVSPVLGWNDEKRGSEAPVFYPGLEVRVDFLDGSFVRAFGGAQPGGRICSGGVCRDVPLFQGVLAELVLRL